MQAFLKSPKLWAIWISLFLLLFPISPSSNLQANFAPPIEPAREQSLEPILPKRTKANKTKKKPIKTFTPKQKLFFGIIAIAVAFGLIGMVIGYALIGIYLFSIINFFIPLLFDIGAWIMFCLIALGIAAVFAVPPLLYGLRLIKNSRKLPASPSSVDWPSLKKEYIWGIIASSTSIPVFLGLAVFMTIITFPLMFLSLELFGAWAALLASVYFLIRALIYNIKKYREDKPTEQPVPVPPSIDEYK